MNIHIKNGRVIDPKNKLDVQQDVYIVARRIAAIGASTTRLRRRAGDRCERHDRDAGAGRSGGSFARARL